LAGIVFLERSVLIPLNYTPSSTFWSIILGYAF